MSTSKYQPATRRDPDNRVIDTPIGKIAVNDCEEVEGQDLPRDAWILDSAPYRATYLGKIVPLRIKQPEAIYEIAWYKFPDQEPFYTPLRDEMNYYRVIRKEKDDASTE